jgi:ubiquinone/menaquinone biosynthesis C-methylase UbiE
MAYRQWQFRLGLEGLAILRTGSIATDAQLAEHVSALTTPITEDDPTFSNIVGGTEVDVSAGYASWAAVYDAPGNPLISHEQPIVHEIMGTWPVPLRVLDVACGTGRHTVHLAELGHDVTGIDASPAMLARAAAKRSDLALVDGFVEALPFATDTFDAAVCSLLFDHLADIDRAVSELARVVRPGGRVLISNIHPTMGLTGAHAAFRNEAGDRNFMRSTHHSVSTNFKAFRAHGLTVVRCEEANWTVATARAQFPFVSEAVARDAIAGLPMALVWELSV